MWVNCQQVLKRIMPNCMKQQKRIAAKRILHELTIIPAFLDCFAVWNMNEFFVHVLKCWCFLSVHFCTRGVFAPARANENKTIHRFTRYPLCAWPNYASELCMNYRRTIGELCGTNWIDEPRLYKEYKWLLGVNYANRAHLVSVGKLGWRTMGRAELSAKSKHNIKSFSKFKELPSLEVTCADE